MSLVRNAMDAEDVERSMVELPKATLVVNVVGLGLPDELASSLLVLESLFKSSLEADGDAVLAAADKDEAESKDDAQGGIGWFS